MPRFQITISEYGKEEVKHSDNNRSRFLEECKKLISNHIDKYSDQGREEVKNIQIHIATIE